MARLPSKIFLRPAGYEDFALPEPGTIGQLNANRMAEGAWDPFVVIAAEAAKEDGRWHRLTVAYPRLKWDPSKQKFLVGPDKRREPTIKRTCTCSSLANCVCRSLERDVAAYAQTFQEVDPTTYTYQTEVLEGVEGAFDPHFEYPSTIDQMAVDLPMKSTSSCLAVKA